MYHISGNFNVGLIFIEFTTSLKLLKISSVKNRYNYITINRPSNEPHHAKLVLSVAVT